MKEMLNKQKMEDKENKMKMVKKKRMLTNKDYKKELLIDFFKVKEIGIVKKALERRYPRSKRLI